MAALLVARCNGSKIFETVDGTLDNVASFASMGIKSWRRPLASFTKPASSRIQELWADAPHAALLDLFAIMPCAISTAHTQAGWPFARTSSSCMMHTDGSEHRPDLSRITALPGRDQDRQRQPVAVGTG